MRNWKRGFFRLWVVGTGLWIAGQGLNVAQLVLDRQFKLDDVPQVTVFGSIFALAPPLAVLLAGAAVFWVTGGFARSVSPGAAPALAPVGEPNWSWSNPETRALYRHLTNGWSGLVHETAARHAERPAAAGETSWDRSPEAVRRFERALREVVENRFDAFYRSVGGATDVASVCGDVGSLWRVNWPELSVRLLAELGHVVRGDGHRDAKDPREAPAMVAGQAEEGPTHG